MIKASLFESGSETEEERAIRRVFDYAIALDRALGRAVEIAGEPRSLRRDRRAIELARDLEIEPGNPGIAEELYAEPFDYVIDEIASSSFYYPYFGETYYGSPEDFAAEAAYYLLGINRGHTRLEDLAEPFRSEIERLEYEGIDRAYSKILAEIREKEPLLYEILGDANADGFFITEDRLGEDRAELIVSEPSEIASYFEKLPEDLRKRYAGIVRRFEEAIERSRS